MIYETEEELLEKAIAAEGSSFEELDKKGRLNNAKSKGGLGHIIEESYFGYEVNSNAAPDFEELGIELKVTPFKINKNGTVSSKERLVLNIINYMEEVQCSFFTSSFWNKNQKILLMLYKWLPNAERKDYQIYKSLLYTFPEADLEIIKQDWETIINKIKAGKAHELSEGDTNYLGACPKGANKKSLRKQPYSEIPAMQRAYALKQSYMTALYRKIIKKEELVSFSKKEELHKLSFEKILENRFKDYIGMSDIQIAETLDIEYNRKAKSSIALLISALLGIKGTRLDKIEEFSKANIQFKTIRLEPNGLPREHMSFENIRFDEWVNEEWEDSSAREKFVTTKFLFVVFQYNETKSENPDRLPHLKGIQLWNMPLQIIDNEVKGIYGEVNRLMQVGLDLKVKKYGKTTRQENNFPKANFNGVAHVRPKAKDRKDTVTLPTGQVVTKQCLWLNREFVAGVLDKTCGNKSRENP
ncbi:Sau3AI family type II restriction endonuclease [Oceanobacillus oncorhynchi subsp. oncorhynchi]|uniref:Sau3AI family type II restriction endonuclease n=1 Tax=Oceanobacillus oncorhynchi TaxID=545501 RepID=UPI00363AEC33